MRRRNFILGALAALFVRPTKGGAQADSPARVPECPHCSDTGLVPRVVAARPASIDPRSVIPVPADSEVITIPCPYCYLGQRWSRYDGTEHLWEWQDEAPIWRRIDDSAPSAYESVLHFPEPVIEVHSPTTGLRKRLR